MSYSKNLEKFNYASTRAFFSIDYAKAIAALVAKMPVERASQVCDFVRFLQTHPIPAPFVEAENDDWLNDTEEQMQAEDALWNATYARHHDKFAGLDETARDEIIAGTQPMFKAEGECTLCGYLGGGRHQLVLDRQAR